jgi:enediyne biosynthesis protein E4
LTADNLKSSVLMKDGAQFKLVSLPMAAQLSPIYAIEILDLDDDKKLDLVVGGNFYKLKPEIGRLDGLNGGYFKGDGKGNFNFISAMASGLKVSGEVRDIVSLGENLVFARNNQTVVSFKRKN